MLFEEEKKALNFLKFNSGDYDDKAPVRAYYCNACMGWHITSKGGEAYVNPVVDMVLSVHNGLFGTYSDEVLKLYNTVLSECGILKKDMNLSGKIVKKKIYNLLENRSILSQKLTSHDFSLINRTVKETIDVVRKRYMIEDYPSGELS